MSELIQALRNRRTEKVLANPSKPLPQSDTNHRTVVDGLIADAGLAPFHYPSSKAHHTELDSNVPWRFYQVDTAGCRKLAEQLNGQDPGSSKIASMLAAAEVLVQITWLPDPVNDATPAHDTLFAGSQRNMEHIAAASAATQSLLLLATEAGYRTYWSSGGVLRSTEVFAQLQIPDAEILLGSIFLFPQDTADADIKPGGWRDKRGESSSWSVWREV